MSERPLYFRGDHELLRTAVDNITAMLAYWDASQRCRMANQAYERWFGVSPETLIGKHMTELLGPLYALNVPYIEAALRGEPQEFEREIPDPRGGPSRHSVANYIPDVVDGVVRGFFVLVTDISRIKRAELALRESEERFRLAFDDAPIGMALVAPDGRLDLVNGALCEIVGYRADELTGRLLQSLSHPDHLAADLALSGRLVRGEVTRCRQATRYLGKDGKVVDVMLNAALLRGADGTPVHYIAQIEDITERKRLEDELRVAEARSSGILAISADAIISIDVDQRITMFNEGAESVFGYSRTEVLGAPVEVLIPERLRAGHRERVAAFARGAVAAGRMGERDAVIVGRRKNGEEFPADAAISKLEVGGTRVLTVAVRDVTTQKRIEAEQRFLAEMGPVLAGSLDYEETVTRIAELAVRDLGDLCIVDIVGLAGDVRRLEVASRDPARRWLCNRLMQLPLDRSRPHLLSWVLENRRALILQDPSEATIASFAQSEEHEQVLRAAEIRSLLAVPLVAHDHLLGAIALVSSTAARRYGVHDLGLAEELAQRAALSIENARLYHTAKLATRARDDVLGIVAHDLRNPLNNIVIQADLLRRTKSGGRAETAAAAIERAARRMSRLIEDLLDVTRMDAGRLSVNPARLSARDVVLESVAAHRQLATKAGLELRVEAAPEVAEVWGDRDRVLQVFENLIGNACKFTPAGGRVSVGASPRGDHVLFWVTDSGQGIAREHLGHLFDRFWQGHAGKRDGAGLGLPIVKGVIEAHGGRVWVESTPGEGSSFYFTLPTGSPAEPEPPQPRPA